MFAAVNPLLLIGTTAKTRNPTRDNFLKPNYSSGIICLTLEIISK